MRKFFISLLLLTLPSLCFAISVSEAQRIYKKIVSINAIRNAPQLRVSNSNEVNASYNGHYIVVNAGMLRFVRNADELAFILGHELGHFMHGDSSSKPAVEYLADVKGAYLAKRAQYNMCKARYVLLRFNDPGSSTHPPSYQRFKRIRC